MGKINKCFLKYLAATLMVVCSFAKYVIAGIPDMHYEKIKVLLKDSEGNAVAGSRVYGYCRAYGLVWPRFDSPQYEKAWENPPVALTNEAGEVLPEVPSARWAFIGVGAVPARQNPTTIICASTTAEVSNDPKEAILAASEKQDITILSPKRNRLKLCGAFCKHPALGVWIPWFSEGDGLPGPWRLQYQSGVETFWICEEPEERAIYVIRHGMPQVESVTKELSTSQLAEIELVRKTEKAKLLCLRWEKVEPGLEGSLNVESTDKIFFTPGEYSISYDVRMEDGARVRFGPGLLKMGAGHRQELVIGAGYEAAIEEQFIPPKDKEADGGLGECLGMLMVRDTLGLVAWHWFDTDNNPAKMSGELEYAAGKSVALSQFREACFSVPREHVLSVQAAAGRVWRIQTPMKSLLGDLFNPEARIVVKTKHFTAEIVRPGEKAMTDFLHQAERQIERMQSVSGRSWDRTTKLYIEPKSGAMGTHNGSAIWISLETLYRNPFAQRHDFVHEATHNLRFYHGPVLELVAELSRCSEAQLTAQIPKWLFFDRMNGRKAAGYIPTRWRDGGRDAPLGMYFYFHNAGPSSFLNTACQLESVFPDCDKLGIERSVAMASVTSHAMGKDVREIWTAYGYSMSPEASQLKQRIAGSTWEWGLAREDVVPLRFGSDGYVDVIGWTRRGLMTRWEVADANTVLLLVVKGRSTDTVAVVKFAPDNLSYSGVEFGRRNLTRCRRLK